MTETNITDTRTRQEQKQPREQLYPDNWRELYDSLPAPELMQAWLKWHFGVWVRELGNACFGYYASRGDGDQWLTAAIRFYAGPGAQRTARTWLQVVADTLDKTPMHYTWKTGVFDFPYLAVDLAEEEEDATVAPLTLSDADADADAIA